MQTKQKQGLHPSLCDFYPLIEMKTKAKRFYSVFDDYFVCGFIVWNLFYCATYVFLRDIWQPHLNEDQTNTKKVFPAYPVWEERWIFH